MFGINVGSIKWVGRLTRCLNTTPEHAHKHAPSLSRSTNMWEGVFCSVGWKPSSSCTSLMPVYALSCAAFAPDAIIFPAASACRRFCSSAARSAAASPGPTDASPAGFFLRTTRPGSARGECKSR